MKKAKFFFEVEVLEAQISGLQNNIMSTYIMATVSLNLSWQMYNRQDTVAHVIKFIEAN